MNRQGAAAEKEQGFSREVLDDAQHADLTRRTSTLDGALLLIREKSGRSGGGRWSVQKFAA